MDGFEFLRSSRLQRLVHASLRDGDASLYRIQALKRLAKISRRYAALLAVPEKNVQTPVRRLQPAVSRRGGALLPG